MIVIRDRSAASSDARARFVVVAVGLVLAGGCGVRLYSPPEGPGVPLPLADAQAAYDAATGQCRDVGALSFSMGMKGRVGDQGLPRGVRYDAAVARDGRLFLQAIALGSERLTFAGRPDGASLWLREGNQAVEGATSDIVRELTGLPLTPATLLDLLTGCVTPERRVRAAERFGDRLRVTAGDADLMLEPVGNDGWRARWASLASLDGLRADYHAADGPWPRELTLYTESAAVPVRLTMTIRTRVVDPPEADVSRAFAWTAPSGATRISLDELRSAVWGREP